ncbi:hypothetical protein DPMN_185526 [Dreissena polymorpha]|uniref:Uncharacterized protein n=1 Tax=Dreissena polymorpha TaxID=45954 RepID=A0A9D4I5M8_DREPO|nr:hypothetical protein DPMN_185526 [Dreissena polymorpha]
MGDVNECHTIKTCMDSQMSMGGEHSMDGKMSTGDDVREGDIFINGGRRAPAPGCNQCCVLVSSPVHNPSACRQDTPPCGCDNPSPSAHGRLCMGDAKDVALCHNSPCPGTRAQRNNAKSRRI